IAFTSVPASDDLALAGSTVVLTADAVDGTGSGVGASGIASIEILDPAGKDVGEPSHFDGPRSCDKSRLAKRITASYTVPQDPPPVFILTVVAIDFAGNKQQVAASYVTTAAWDGVIFARTVAVVPGTTCRQSWQVTFSIVADANGAVTGSGDATPMSPPSCPIDPSVITSDEAVSVSGTFDGKMFHIHFDLGAGGGYDTGLHVLWFPTPVIIDIRWGAANAGSGTADLNITNDVGELAGLPASASLNGYIQLLLKRPGG
ncbi:MAG: hypothetical protein ACXVKP_14800, partial [Ilumatobacteraceae bacterium]